MESRGATPSSGGFLAGVDARVGQMGRALDRIPGRSFIATTIVASVGISVLFFSPRLFILLRPAAGSYEWARAATYLAQCAQPFAPPSEPAMRWRLLPPLAAHVLRLPGYWPLALPWAGLVLLAGYLARSVERLASSRLAALLAVALLFTTGPVLFVTMCNGINDAWWMLALLAVVFSESWWPVAVACALGPWVDERFLLALPLAGCCRWVCLGSAASLGRRGVMAVGAAALVYPAVRIFSAVSQPDDVSAAFIKAAVASVPHYLPFAHLGWWMGYRGAWFVMLMVFWHLGVAPTRRMMLLTLGASLAALASITLLAADLTRSTDVLLPLFAAGVCVAAKSFGAPTASRLLLALLAFNLATPFEMVIYDKTLMLHSLPFELARLIKHWH
jgi:hypothetical protein